MSDTVDSTQNLQRTLGPVTGTAMMLNVVIGAGILVLPGIIVAQSGATSVWIWLITALATLPVLMVLSRLSADHPHEGGVAHLADVAIGPWAARAGGYLLIGAVVFGGPSLALTGGYWFEDMTGFSANSIAIGIALTAIAANLLTPGLAKRLGAAGAVLIMAFLALLIIATLWTFGTAGIDGAGQLMSTHAIANLPDALTLVLIAFFAFTGWEISVNMTGEFREPERNVPVAIYASFGIATALYLIIAVLVLLMGKTDPYAPFADFLNLRIGGLDLIATGGLIVTSINLFAAMWGVSRMLFSMGQKGSLPAAFGRLSGGAPRIAVLVFGGLVLINLVLHRYGLLDIEAMLSLASLNFLALYGLACIAGLILLTGVRGRLIAIIAVTTVIVMALATATVPQLLYPAAWVLAAAIAGWFSGRQTQG